MILKLYINNRRYKNIQNKMDQKNEDFKIGNYIYEIFDPNNQGIIDNIYGNTITMKTKNGLKEYPRDRVTKDYHSIITTLIGVVDEWKELWFQKKKEVDILSKK